VTGDTEALGIISGCPVPALTSPVCRSVSLLTVTLLADVVYTTTFRFTALETYIDYVHIHDITRLVLHRSHVINLCVVLQLVPARQRSLFPH
jgi:hypothetical protein